MPYTPIVAPGDLKNKMYAEVMAAITRGDNTITLEAIDSAIREVKMYLGRYDLVKLFGSASLNVAAVIIDPFLNNLVKTIATWHLLRLANPNVDLAIALTWYDQAIATLKNIQKGMATPEGWPYLDTTGETAPQGNAIYSTGNDARSNHF